MPNSESHTYTVAVSLLTEDGKLPSPAEARRLIEDQMAGVLDEGTGLQCGGVRLVSFDDPPHLADYSAPCIFCDAAWVSLGTHVEMKHAPTCPYAGLDDE